jgi:truncated hemoglobin YjbI
MHWYVGFRDPVPVPGREPTLFEWAGGLPALTRMTRLLYEKHVPADELLAPLFVSMPREHPRREAMLLAEVFGGPAWSSADRGDQQLASAHAGRSLTEQQRARWVTLATQAADEAGLPADAEFRAAFTAYLEWGSRAAADLSQAAAAPPASTAAAAPPASTAVPRWGWTAAGPPHPATAVAATDPAAEPSLPGPGQEVRFDVHIKPLFRASDRQSMSFVFDLASAADVRAHAADILDRLRSGSMPCDGAWASDKIEVFRRWAESGMQS